MTIAKSSKRGIAFDLASAEDLSAIASGVSWWYNWAPVHNAKVPLTYRQTYYVDYIHMLWGGTTSAADKQTAKTVILSHPELKYLLVMNEPNLVNQANRTPAQAAADWLKYEQVISDIAAQGRTVYLIGPAMTWGTMANYSDPAVWLDACYAAYRAANSGRDPKLITWPFTGTITA